MTKSDVYTEIHLWNQGIDRLVHVLQRLESDAICSKQELKTYQLRLEEIRAGLNADFAETMGTRERADQLRLWHWRITLERHINRPN